MRSIALKFEILKDENEMIKLQWEFLLLRGTRKVIGCKDERTHSEHTCAKVIYSIPRESSASVVPLPHPDVNHKFCVKPQR